MTYSLEPYTSDFKEPYWGTPVASSASRLFTQRIRIIISFIKRKINRFIPTIKIRGFLGIKPGNTFLIFANAYTKK